MFWVCCKNDFLNCKNDFLNCKNDFLNFLKRRVLQSFPPKTQGFACKSGVILEFWGVCMRLLKIIAHLMRDAYSLKRL
ncbi:hypothetical protein BZK20_02910 [Helicobacter pylori]|nr:hypothetical protein BZK20_02910 [Helicobacter pylori]